MDPKKGVAYSFELSLVDSANRPQFKINPTIASGDFLVSQNGGALAPLATTPTVTPAGSTIVTVSLSSAEMNADKVFVQAHDVSGSQWDDVSIFIDNNVRNIDDVAFPTVSGRSLAVDTSGDVAVSSIAPNTITDATILRYRGAVVADLGNTSSSFKTNLGGVTDFYKDMILKFTSGALNGEIKKVTAFTSGTGFVSIFGVFTTTPSGGDNFDLING